MRKFEKSSKLDNVCYDIRGPVMDEANRMVAEGVNVLKLNIGNPAPHGLMAPDEVVRDMSISCYRCADIYRDTFSLPRNRLLVCAINVERDMPRNTHSRHRCSSHTDALACFSLEKSLNVSFFNPNMGLYH